MSKQPLNFAKALRARRPDEATEPADSLVSQSPYEDSQPPKAVSQQQAGEVEVEHIIGLPISQSPNLPISQEPGETARQRDWTRYEQTVDSRKGRERVQARVQASKVSELQKIDFFLRQRSRKKKGYIEAMVELGIDWVLANQHQVMDALLGGQSPNLLVSQPSNLPDSQSPGSPPINNLMGNKIHSNNDLLLLYVEKLSQWGARPREADETVLKEFLGKWSIEDIEAGILVTAARVMLMVINEQPAPKINGFRYCENVIEEMHEMGAPKCLEYARFAITSAERWFKQKKA